LNLVDVVLIVSFSPLILTLFIHTVYILSSSYNREERNSLNARSPSRAKSMGIVVPVKNEPIELVRGCVAYLDRVLKDLDRDIALYIVSDDDEKYVDKLRNSLKGLELRLPVVVVRRGGPGGRVAALNYALYDVVKEELMVILDVDARPSREFFEGLLECSEHSDVCVGHWVGYWTVGTRIARALAFSTDIAATALYKGRQSLGLLVFPLGSGTLFKTNVLKAVGGWEHGTLQDDVIIGMKLHGVGYRISYSSKAIVRVLVPSSYRAFRIQQLKWAYGALESLKYSFKYLSRKTGFLRSLEARLYTLQYLPAITTLLASTIIPALAIALSTDVTFPTLVIAGIVPTIYTLSILKTFRQKYGSSIRVLRILGTTSAIGLVVAPVVAKGVILGVLGKKLRAPVTPKGLKDRENYREYLEEYLTAIFSAVLGLVSLLKGLYIASILGLLPLVALAYTFLRAAKTSPTTDSK